MRTTKGMIKGKVASEGKGALSQRCIARSATKVRSDNENKRDVSQTKQISDTVVVICHYEDNGP